MLPISLNNFSICINTNILFCLNDFWREKKIPEASIVPPHPTSSHPQTSSVIPPHHLLSLHSPQTSHRVSPPRLPTPLCPLIAPSPNPDLDANHTQHHPPPRHLTHDLGMRNPQCSNLVAIMLLESWSLFCSYFLIWFVSYYELRLYWVIWFIWKKCIFLWKFFSVFASSV